MLLWFLVEGEHDEDFIRRVIQPRLPQRFTVQVWRFGRRTKQKRGEFLRSLHSPSFSQVADYWIVADQDQHPCFTACRDFVVKLFDDVPPPSKIICPHQSIEAWYVAGFTQSSLFRKLQFSTAEGMHKRDFDRIIQSCGYSLSQRSEILTECWKDTTLYRRMRRARRWTIFAESWGFDDALCVPLRPRHWLHFACPSTLRTVVVNTLVSQQAEQDEFDAPQSNLGCSPSHPSWFAKVISYLLAIRMGK